MRKTLMVAACAMVLGFADAPANDKLTGVQVGNGTEKVSRANQSAAEPRSSKQESNPWRLAQSQGVTCPGGPWGSGPYEPGDQICYRKNIYVCTQGGNWRNTHQAC